MALPTVAKKPFDAIETIEHKISGLVATGAFVPIMVGIIHEANSTGGQPTLSLASLGFAAAGVPNWLYDIFGDAGGDGRIFHRVPRVQRHQHFNFAESVHDGGCLAKSFSHHHSRQRRRHRLHQSVDRRGVGAHHPVHFVADRRLVISALAFRHRFSSGNFSPAANTASSLDAKENNMFLGRKTEKVPTRTYGKLSRNEQGELVFDYRPWLILPLRTLILPAGNYETGRGLFYSEILRVEGNSAKTVMLLPPRYRGHEEEVARIYNFAGTRDVGIRAAWAWFKSLFTEQDSHGLKPWATSFELISPAVFSIHAGVRVWRKVGL